MDGASGASVHRGEPTEVDGDGPGDLGRALDELTVAFDDERVRRVIDALIHPSPATVSGPVAQPEPDSPVPPARGADRPGAALDALGLCRADAWHRLLEVEHACAARYGAKTTVIQLEVSEVAVIATVLGEAAAGRLVSVLADTVREETRDADTFARISRWRIAGLLPYTDGRTADAVTRRIAEGFGRRLGSGLPARVAVGRAEVDPSLDPAATLARAEGAMTVDPRRAVGGGPGNGRVDAWPGATSEVRVGASGAPPDPDDRDGRRRRGTDTPVADSLRELERLRADGLVSEAEYHKTRRRILRRV
jgi:GGDEF domain-containing protein